MHFRIKPAALIFLLFLSVCLVVPAKSIWESDQFKILLDDNYLELYAGDEKFAEITGFLFNFIPVQIDEIKNVNDNELELRLLLNETDGFNKDFPSEVKMTITFQNNTFHFYAYNETFNHITIQMKDLDEHYFGLLEKLYPHNSKNPDLRGETVDVEVYSQGYEGYAENYASAYSAFFISSKGYGSFFDTFAKGRYHLAVNGITEIYHQTQKLDWYLFYGPTGDKIHSEYYDVIGKPKYVPIWACGPIFWRDENFGGKDQILDDIQKFTDLEIPLTACFVDRPYSNGADDWSKMDFNEKFANPEVWIKTINDKYGMEFMTWIASLTFGDTDFPGLLPNYKGYMDLTNPETVAEFEKRLSENQYSVNVKGHKMDRADEGFPVAAKWHDKITESESRNKYVYLFTKVIDKFLTNAHGKDQFTFARAAFHRSQPYLSAIWGGDVRSNWHGLAGNQANAIRAGFLGFPVWGSDTGGYLGEGGIDEQLYIRWLEWSMWNGMFQVKIDGSGGRGEDRPPWKYSKQLQDVFRDACDVRMEMLPYAYSLANTSDKNGVMMKPLTYLYPSDEKTYGIWDEFMFGDAFLIAPILTTENSRDIYLPEGKWYDYHDMSKTYAGPVTIHQDVPLDRIPVFIKENSIYVTGNIYQGNSKIWKSNSENGHFISIKLFPGIVNDETTFTYMDYLDSDKTKEMVLKHEAGKIVFTSDNLTCPAEIKLIVENKPEKILLDKKEIEFKFDAEQNLVSFNVEKGKNINVEVSYAD